MPLKFFACSTYGKYKPLLSLCYWVVCRNDCSHSTHASNNYMGQAQWELGVIVVDWICWSQWGLDIASLYGSSSCSKHQLGQSLTIYCLNLGTQRLLQVGLQHWTERILIFLLYKVCPLVSGVLTTIGMAQSECGTPWLSKLILNNWL